MNVRIAIGHAVSICESEITAKDLTIQTRLDATRDTIHGDMTRLQQILWNLLRNAVKFTPKGGTIRIASENDADGHLLVRIQDDGVGIAAVILPRIFEPFCQGNPTMSQRSGGIGLGLAISKALAEQHGGTLSAQSAGLGQGAEFILRFPTVDTVAAAEAGAISILPAAKPLRILVVEDDPETRRLLCKLLTVLGHQVLQAGDVASGRKALACNQLDLLLSDIGLPDGTGYDLMKEVPASLPALALTGYGMESDVQQSLAAGFREHLTKPVDVPRLQAAIHRIAGM
jgi:CheY-like chemotaxis protein